MTYAYDEQGNLASTVVGSPGVSPVTTTVSHDLLGRKTAMTDPDMGTWSYEYNAFGELIRQTNARGDVVRVAYDALGRMVHTRSRSRLYSHPHRYRERCCQEA